MAISLIIDAKFWDDPRFIDLKADIGEQRGLGACGIAWRIGFGYWYDGERLIPEKVWKATKLPNALLEHRLAEKREGGIYVFGVKEHVEKHRAMIEKSKSGGLASAQSRKNKNANDNKQSAQPRVEAGSNPGTTPVQPSSSLSSSSKETKPEDSRVLVLALSKTWKETLRKFGHDRNLTSREEQLIFWASKKDSAELIDQALLGAAFEPKVKDFDPARAPDIARILGDPKAPGKPSQLAKFCGYASAAKPDGKKTMADLEAE